MKDAGTNTKHDRRIGSGSSRGAEAVLAQYVRDATRDRRDSHGARIVALPLKRVEAPCAQAT